MALVLKVTVPVKMMVKATEMIKHKMTIHLATSPVLAVGLLCFSSSTLSPVSGAETNPGTDSKSFSDSQSCRECHERFYQLWSTSFHGLAMQPYHDALISTYAPGEKFFDHFDLVTLESPDYYPDGRDLGENYTYTSWLMSPCVKSGKLDCMHCHTSSGRYRFKTAEDANNACLPCHDERVHNAPAHTHHEAGSLGSRCVSCHMPTTSFSVRGITAARLPSKH